MNTLPLQNEGSGPPLVGQRVSRPARDQGMLPLPDCSPRQFQLSGAKTVHVARSGHLPGNAGAEDGAVRGAGELPRVSGPAVAPAVLSPPPPVAVINSLLVVKSPSAPQTAADANVKMKAKVACAADPPDAKVSPAAANAQPGTPTAGMAQIAN